MEAYVKEIKYQFAYKMMYEDRIYEIFGENKIIPQIEYDFLSDIGNRPYDIAEYFKDIGSLTLRYIGEARNLYTQVSENRMDETAYYVILHYMQDILETARRKNILTEMISTDAIKWIDNYLNNK